MRVVLVSTGTLPGFGSNFRVLGLARHLFLQGIDAHILLPGWPDNRARFPGCQFQGVPIHFTETGDWSEMRSKYDLLRSLHPDVVQCMNVVKRSFLPCLLFRKFSTSKLIVDLDEYLSRVYIFPKNAYAEWGERTALRRADSIIVASRFLEKEFSKAISGNLLYLPNAIDLGLFQRYRTGWEEVRERWAGMKIVSCLGNLLSHYDTDLAFDVAVRILKKRRDLVFLFFGAGPMLETFRRQTVDLHLEEWIHWYGFVPEEELPKYFTASDVLLFPIRDNIVNRARCPMRIYHYLAAMVPIVTNPVGEVAEALGDRAWYFQNGSVENFSETLEKCLEAGEQGPRPDEAMAVRNSWEDRMPGYLRFLQDTVNDEVGSSKPRVNL